MSDMLYVKERPAIHGHFEISPQVERNGQSIFIIKNLDHPEYLKVSPLEMFLWEYMDGRNTLEDLERLFHEKFGLSGLKRIENLINLLDNKGWIVIHDRKRAQRTPEFPAVSLFARRLSAISQTRITIRGFDHSIQKIYDCCLWVIFTPLGQGMLGIVTAIGLVLFWVQARQTPPQSSAPITWVSTLIFTLAYILVTLMMHEFAHALTCKHFGREVNAAGFMLYFGMPAFFVDTTDVWMAPRRARILVSWAGPYANFILAAVASIVYSLWPGLLWKAYLFQFVALSVFVGLFNLIPLLKFDGYYILSELFGQYNLREKTFRFFMGGALVDKVFRREPFSKEELTYVLYGIPAFFASAFLIHLAWRAWQGFFGDILNQLLAYMT